MTSMKTVLFACSCSSFLTNASVMPAAPTNFYKCFYFVIRLYWLRHDSLMISWQYMRKMGA